MQKRLNTKIKLICNNEWLSCYKETVFPVKELQKPCFLRKRLSVFCWIPSKEYTTSSLPSGSFKDETEMKQVENKQMLFVIEWYLFTRRLGVQSTHGAPKHTPQVNFGFLARGCVWLVVDIIIFVWSSCVLKLISSVLQHHLFNNEMSLRWILSIIYLKVIICCMDCLQFY